MNIEELRKIISTVPKFPGTKIFLPASVCNDGFPSCFNLSLTEAEMFERWGQYLKYDNDLIYSKIQPCIRHQDWQTIIDDKDNSYRYLSLFDMADVGGIIIQKDNSRHQEAIEFSINSIVEFLKSLGLDINKLKISYFDGAIIKEATAGKYDLNKYFPMDPEFNYWKEKFGLRDDQLIPNHDRSTMLALSIFGFPSPWGYRNEIFYEHKGKLLDIGTVEHAPYAPVFDDNSAIIDIRPFEHSVAISGVGVERISMVINGLDKVWDVDTIKPMVDESKKIFRVDEHDAMIITQVLRVAHRIITDVKSYANLNRKRKEYFRAFLKPLFCYLNSEDDYGNIDKLVELHADLESYYPELKSSVEQTVNEIRQRKIAFINDKSSKHRGVAQQ